jgi:hypothetical protein
MDNINKGDTTVKGFVEENLPRIDANSLIFFIEVIPLILLPRNQLPQS